MRVTRQLTVAGAALLGLLAHAVIGMALARSASDPFEAMGVDRAGTPFPAPEGAFRSLEGREARLHTLRGKVVLLGFFTTA